MSSSPAAIPTGSSKRRPKSARSAPRPSTPPTRPPCRGSSTTCPAPIDHVMVTAGGPHYGPLLEMDAAQVREAISDHVVQALEVARNAAGQDEAGRHAAAHGRHRRPAHRSRPRASSPPPPPRCPRSRRPSRSSSRRSASTSSPPASSTPRCRRRCSETGSRSAATSCGRRSRSAASSAPPTSPRSPSTS